MTIVSLVPKRVAAGAPGSIQSPDLDPAQFRRAMRQLVGGVSVITTGRGTQRTGLVATSVSALSAEPPTLMFGLNLGSSSFPVLRDHGAFAVNFLTAGQQALADRFAGRGGEKGPARYGSARWTEGVTGAALLDDALASIDCEVEELIERHSHAIVIGRIREIRLGREEAALVYWRGGYDGLGAPSEAATGLSALRLLSGQPS